MLSFCSYASVDISTVLTNTLGPTNYQEDGHGTAQIGSTTIKLAIS